VSAPGSQRGYALLVAVLVTALAAVFAAACVAAVGARVGVAQTDRSAATAAAVAGETLDQACASLRRRPDLLEWDSSGVASGSGVTWRLACSPEPQLEATSSPRVDVAVLAAGTTAESRLRAVVELDPAPQAQGLEVAHDAHVEATLTVGGGGLYCGGSVSGREHVVFVDPAPSAPVAQDHVHGDLWPAAAVHALGGIFAAGEEVHGASPVDPLFAADTDVHTGSGEVERVTSPPPPELWTLLRQTADLVAAPDASGVVDLAGLPTSPGAAGLVATVGDTYPDGVIVRGERPAAAGPLVLLVDGDVRLGTTRDPTSFTGALVVFGAVTVDGPTRIVGHCWALRLDVEAPLEVVTPLDWRARPLAGLAEPVLAALGR
jgi:hypothetical protein